jgi:hypothetical protein
MAIPTRVGFKALGALAIAVGLAACGGSGGSANDELPLIKVNVKVKSVSQGGVCETVPVRISPKALSGAANKYSNNKQVVTEVEMTGPTDENGAPMCNGEKQTLPLAPGVWEFRAPLPSDMVSCEHDVQATGDLEVAFVDGMPGCGDPEPAAAEAPASADGAAMPADAAAPAEGAPAEGAPATPAN